MLTVNQTSTLVQILAHTDALFCPFRVYRDSNPNAAAGLAERRTDYSTRGVPLVVAGSGTQRLAGERELQKLETAGLIVIYRRRKRIGVSLTERGDNVVRKLTAGYLARESFYLLELTEAVKAEFGGRTNAGFVLEADVLGREYDTIQSSNLILLENLMLPLLSRGWMRSGSDVRGAVGYQTTKAGRRAMAAGKPQTGRLPKYDHIAGGEYDEMFVTALAERDEWKPDSPSHVAIPLSCGRWPRLPGDAPFEFHFQEGQPLHARK